MGVAGVGVGVGVGAVLGVNKRSQHASAWLLKDAAKSLFSLSSLSSFFSSELAVVVAIPSAFKTLSMTAARPIQAAGPLLVAATTVGEAEAVLAASPSPCPKRVERVIGEQTAPAAHCCAREASWRVMNATLLL